MAESDVFTSAPGTVAVMTTSNTIPGRIQIFDTSDQEAFADEPVLIAAIGYRQNTNQQFQMSLDNAIYLYVFGDRMGELVIEGLAFPAFCNLDDTSGINSVFDYYNSNRVSQTSDLVYAQVSLQTISGFLTGLEVSGNSASPAEDTMGLAHRFRMMISTMPEEVENDEGGGEEPSTPSNEGTQSVAADVANYQALQDQFNIDWGL